MIFSRTFRYLLIVGGAIMGILLFLLASASENTGFLEEYYPWLLGINLAVATALLVLVLFLLVRIVRRIRRGRFGSKLMMRLVILFALVGILPGAVIYAVSVQFVSRSIETWFDVRVETALDSGVKLGQNMLETSLAELNSKAEQLAAELSGLPLSGKVVLLSQQRNDPLVEVSLLNGSGQVIATSSGDYQRLLPDLPTHTMLQQAATTTRYSAIEGEYDDPGTEDANEASLQLRVILPLEQARLGTLLKETYYLHLIQHLSPTLAFNAESLRAAYSEYQVRSLSRSGLRKMYIVTLTLTLLLVIFAAISAALQIASNLTRPLLLLAQGTKAIAQGNLSPRRTVEANDELGTLIQSFNDMTLQLADAREQAEDNRKALEIAKVYLESVLANMSAGVLVLDQDFRLVSFNEAVERILGINLDTYEGSPLPAIPGLDVFAAAISTAFSELSARTAANAADSSGTWQKQLELSETDHDGEQSHDIVLLARGSRMPVEEQNGYIIVFDDITDLISAQRSFAWGEVARRLAHEIKNPLTPIQLSAERLQHKLESKLEDGDARFLDRSTETIVNQVTAMKRMVDDFRNYARTPPAQLTTLDLNSLIEEIAHLYTGDDGLDVLHVQLEQELPLVMGDATRLRQVIHNLLQNAFDALEETVFESGESARIDVITEKVTYHNASNEKSVAVRLSVKDNGPGFQQKILARIFEPYATTKERGTGLGMAVVKKIIDEHGGQIDVHNRQDARGALVSILLFSLAGNHENHEEI